MKKILFYNMTMAAGGAERVIANLANKLSENNNVKIITMLNMDIAYELNCDIEVLQPNKSDKKNLKVLFKNAIFALNNIKQYKPDYIISFGATSCFFICFFRLFFKQVKKSKLVISERNNPECEYNNIILKSIANFLYSLADVVVFQTEDAKKFFSKKIRKKGIIIPNPINEKFIKKESDNNIDKEKTIVSVGRLEYQKNHQGLIKACKIVFSKFPEYKLKIYGVGELKEDLLKLAQKCEIDSKVELLGLSNHLENDLLNNDIFVLNSNFEGMPNSLMEAMALGMPCIATDCPCGGPKMLIENNQNGILIPVGNDKVLSEKIIELIEKPDLKKLISKNAKKIINDYSPEKIYSEWENVINRNEIYIK